MHPKCATTGKVNITTSGRTGAIWVTMEKHYQLDYSEQQLFIMLKKKVRKYQNKVVET